MTYLSNYAFSLFGVALVCGIVCTIGKDSGFYALLKLLSGVFLTLTLISPFSDISLVDVSPFDLPFAADAREASKAGEYYAQNALANIIKQETQAYILDKASQLQLSVQVDVTVNNDPVPVPVKVCITGAVTQEQHKQLEQILTNDLNIAKENQTWIGQ